MLMSVVQIGIMRMLVAHRFVPVQVGMRLIDRPIVMVAMMRVVRMGMGMFQRLMTMVMFVALGQVQPNAQRH